MLYELWNEVDAELWYGGTAADYYTALSGITSWHTEMAEYIKSLDIYDHLVSTSCGQFRR